MKAELLKPDQVKGFKPFGVSLGIESENDAYALLALLNAHVPGVEGKDGLWNAVCAGLKSQNLYDVEKVHEYERKFAGRFR